MNCDVFVNSYDSDSMLGYYLKVSSGELVAQYQAVKACQDILISGSSELGNSYMAEFTDSVVDIMREAMVERYIDMMVVEKSDCKVVRLADCVV